MTSTPTPPPPPGPPDNPSGTTSTKSPWNAPSPVTTSPTTISPRSNNKRSSAASPPAAHPSATSPPNSAPPSAPSPDDAHPSARHDQRTAVRPKPFPSAAGQLPDRGHSLQGIRAARCVLCVPGAPVSSTSPCAGDEEHCADRAEPLFGSGLGQLGQQLRRPEVLVLAQ